MLIWRDVVASTHTVLESLQNALLFWNLQKQPTHESPAIMGGSLVVDPPIPKSSLPRKQIEGKCQWLLDSRGDGLQCMNEAKWDMVEVADGRGRRQARLEQVRAKLRRSKQGLKERERGFKKGWQSLQECGGGLECSLLDPSWLRLLTRSRLGSSRPGFCLSFNLRLRRLEESF